MTTREQICKEFDKFYRETLDFALEEYTKGRKVPTAMIFFKRGERRWAGAIVPDEGASATTAIPQIVLQQLPDMYVYVSEAYGATVDSGLQVRYGDINKREDKGNYLLIMGANMYDDKKQDVFRIEPSGQLVKTEAQVIE